MKKAKRLLSVLAMVLLVICMAVSVSAENYYNTGYTQYGDFVVGTGSLQEFSGRTVDGNLYVVNGGSYTFYGTLTVNGNIYVFGDFYNHGTINVSGTLYCLNYYYAGIPLDSATKTENGVTTGFSYGNFWNNGKISGNIKVDAQINNIEPPVVHVHTPGAESTCTEDQVCTTCGAILKKATGHTPGAYATCTTPQKCTKCGIILKKATGHVPGSKATCTKEQTCTVCGAVLASKIPHTPGPKATCEDDQICVECGTVIKKALGHNPGKSAACTEAQYCTRCGKVLAEPTGHNWSEWKEEKAATYYSSSEIVRRCSKCGEKEMRYGDAVRPTGKANYKNVVLQKGKSTTAVKITGMVNGDYLKSVVPKNKKLAKVTAVKQNGSFKITALKKTGKTVVTATLASGVTVDINLTVQSKAVKTTKLSVNKSTVNLTKGGTFTIKATKTPFNSKDTVKFSSSNKKVATVSSKGKIVAKKNGTAYITVKAGNVSKKVKVVVKNKKVTTSPAFTVYETDRCKVKYVSGEIFDYYGTYILNAKFEVTNKATVYFIPNEEYESQVYQNSQRISFGNLGVDSTNGGPASQIPEKSTKYITYSVRLNDTKNPVTIKFSKSFQWGAPTTTFTIPIKGMKIVKGED